MASTSGHLDSEWLDEFRGREPLASQAIENMERETDSNRDVQRGKLVLESKSVRCPPKARV